MCKCTPSVRTPFCGKLGCEWPGSKPEGARVTDPAGAVRKLYVRDWPLELKHVPANEEWYEVALATDYDALSQQLAELQRERDELLATINGEFHKRGRIGPDTHDSSMVICPHCTSQFGAISMSDQKRIAALEQQLAELQSNKRALEGVYAVAVQSQTELSQRLAEMRGALPNVDVCEWIERQRYDAMMDDAGSANHQRWHAIALMVAALASSGREEAETLPTDHSQLMRHYGVQTTDALIAMMEQQINRLIAERQKTEPNWPRNYREG